MQSQSWKKKRSVINHYDKLVKVYDSLYTDEQNQKIECILRIVRVAQTDYLLDVGCGTGLLFNHIDCVNGFYIGVEISSGLLRTAVNRIKQLSAISCAFIIRADADYLPFKNEVIDKIFALTLLQNMPHPSVTLKEMMRIAKDNSTIVVTGLKKTFTKERFRSMLRKADLKYYILRPQCKIQDLIAICHKKQK